MKPLGPQIRSAMDDLCSNLESVLGSDRWAMVNPNRWEMTHYEQVRLLGYSQFAWDTGQEFAGNLFIDNGTEPTVSFTGEGGVGTSAIPLKWFLPRSAGSKKSQGQQFLDTVLNGYPDSIGKRLNQWALTQAVRFQNNN
jgi:hypothetical protein